MEVLIEARYFIWNSSESVQDMSVANNSFLFWVPAHVGVEGNEEVDGMAKQAVRHWRIEVNVLLSKSEIKGLVQGALKGIWQERWDKEDKGRHLYNIQSHDGYERNVYGNRRDETILTRLDYSVCSQ